MDTEDEQELLESLSPEEKEAVDALPGEDVGERRQKIAEAKAMKEEGEVADIAGAREARSRAVDIAGAREIGDSEDVKDFQDIDEEEKEPWLITLMAKSAVGSAVVGVGRNIEKGLSGIFKALEDYGTNLIKKNAGWVKWVPWVGPWLLKKAEKSLGEKAEEAKKKALALKKTKKKTAKKQKDLEKAGFTKEQSKRIAEITEEDGEEDEKKGGKKEAAPKPEPEPAPAETKKAA